MAHVGSAGRHENGRHEDRLAREDSVADRVDAAVDGVQSTVADAVADRVPPETQSEQLGPGNDAVLALRERRDRFVDTTRSTLCVAMALNVERVSHGAMLTRQVRRRNRRIAPEVCQSAVRHARRAAPRHGRPPRASHRPGPPPPPACVHEGMMRAGVRRPRPHRKAAPGKTPPASSRQAVSLSVHYAVAKRVAPRHLRRRRVS